MINVNLNIITKYYLKQTLFSRFFSLTTTNQINQKWRQERGLPLNPNACGVLTDKPDYTFLDGRPTPCGVNQRRRIVKQREITEKIIALTKEVDFAVLRHEQIKKEDELARKKLLDSKLKPKGKMLIK
ncbi:large ribosomal subunit protein mL52 [Onthophagus taurus]|uniref:large ribosomal subunit protein mL52 n=1 Tax=Onthophagus taurus TaxID=166361 RepID=UPI000C201AA8|nr:39S ribosomal protein L52, mitochondrial [Onthophagus taurus]